MILAVQTYSVHDELMRDFEATFRRLNSLGFTAYELSHIPWNDKTMKRLEALQKELPLEVVSLQVKPAILAQRKEEIADYAHRLHCSNVIVSMIPPRVILGNEKAFFDFIDELNSLALYYQKQGLQFGYHHHHWEFVRLHDGESRLSHLVHDTHNVVFVNDTYWTARSGVDPADTIALFGEKLLGVHLRDIQDEKALWQVKTKDASLGEGYLNFARIFDALRNNPVVYAAIEQGGKNGLVHLKTSRDYLLEKGYLASDGIHFR